MNIFDDENDEENDSADLDLIQLKASLCNFDSEKLCQMIVCDRYFNYNQEVAIMCMEELSKRRQSGDEFNFELFIENSLKELPPLDFSTPDLKTILNKFIKK